MTVSLEEKLKFDKVTGKSNNAEANIAGITPAVLILRGKFMSKVSKNVEK